MRVLAFRIWGDFAHFRRHYTTSSPLTHSIIPPSALRGLVGAILGLPSKEYPKVLSLNKCKFGVRLLSPVKKVRLGMNYMDTKDGKWVKFNIKTKQLDTKGRLHTQIRLELLKNPFYEVYFHHENEYIMDDLKQKLLVHAPVYTPYLGITECIANFEFQWDENVNPISEENNILSALKTESLKELRLKDGIKLIKDSLPLFIDEQRKRLKSEEIIFNPYGEMIFARVEEGFIHPKINKGFTFIG